MDNWFTSKPLFDKLVRLEQYPYGTMERKQYVPPFVTFGPMKRPTLDVPKGSWKVAHSVDRKLSLWPYMDSSLIFILDTCWGGRKE
eukprot:5890484-Ditylum_brightwellii.AAC.1